ncbi:LysR family transcriptional regulator [Roseiarcaceae bacterium H3SJ34-1]|uniref:LysR family transcriptional regulator n=1 Tax=Terripilifer ovatus TaxID=3032367 RepID=UPI003AB9592A|nr:LysR family transcriptional regulator [Roseiarcaceae bacterium H3SJ34-1]
MSADRRPSIGSLPQFDIRHVHYFSMVARSGSFSAASKMLNVSQPALGQQIKALEEILGVTLFERHSRGVTLTPAGIEFQRRADELLNLWSELSHAMEGFSHNLKGQARLGVTPTSSRLLAMSIIGESQNHPQLALSLKYGFSYDLLRSLEAGDLDIALCYDPPATTPFANQFPLYREPLFLIGPSEVVARYGPEIHFDNITGIPLILDSRFHVIRERVESVAMERGIQINVRSEIEPINLKRDVLLNKDACTILPYALFEEDIASNSLSAAKIVDPCLIQTMTLLVAKSFSPSISGFIRDTISNAASRLMQNRIVTWFPVN